MALIEYKIDEDGTATPTLLEVDIGDRIQFSSKNPDTAIEFQSMSPFKGPRAPAANQTFHVGKSKKGPFRIAVTSKHKIRVKCTLGTGTPWPGLKGKAAGFSIPPGRDTEN